MPREFQESDILFAHVIQNADCTGFSAGQPDNFSPGTAQLPLQRLHVLYRLVEVLLKEIFENVHDVRREHSRSSVHHKDIIERRPNRRVDYSDVTSGN